MSNLQLPENPSYPIHITMPVIWGDMDAFAHVNNTNYIRWCEAVRMAYMEALDLKEHFSKTRIGPILARTEIDYFIPLTSPDTVTVSMSVTQLGNTSFISKYRITSQAHEGKLAAQSQAVLVLIDYSNGKKVILDETVRSKIIALENSKK